MAEAQHWVPKMAPHVDTAEEYIRIRKRRQHSATRVGQSRESQPFTIDVTHLDWHDDGQCRYVDPELFFPENTPDPRALAICGGCPVQQKCLDDALADPRRIGIWGGTTHADRDRMRGSGRAVQQAGYRAARKAAAAESTDG